jgi:hypothetical protein
MSARTDRLESQVKYLSQALAGVIDHCQRNGGSPPLRTAKWTLDSGFMGAAASCASAESASPVLKNRA